MYTYTIARSSQATSRLARWEDPRFVFWLLPGHHPRVIRFGKPVPPDVDAHIQAFSRELAADPRIEAIWLFGSRARGEADRMSDVDLAVLAKRSASSRELFDWQVEWTALAARILHTDEVAVQALNRMPLAMVYDVLRGARLLWARSPEIAADFELETTRRYLDFKPYLERYDRDLFRQAGTGSLR